ncbi:imidazole glycerol phosphate synthase subunit HisH [Subtercola boreus]|uniref:Imidazole glycerol phosphate synthase subunit HisH n=1 Tax=Subtercola boreus TaxID=120213 RepID=A0A3E0WBR8_9MICO|nr:imidazole glycerol phosphate synthase subunit HisH [Subtercola boreus]RFA21838.1 imidazole glycerol phosphate synthase subunit HisH [Subtercola boreus]RFA21949.1 imidazole glycerol phosphate synthase subunit HisH [Subtercola boreus]RFA27897.1 imidazole glycerol phosphate synthase subunit HisH [Subtercola boreus]
MTAKSVVVLDYGSGNVHSAVKALEKVGASVELTADRTRVGEADGLLVPGVGAFSAVIEALDRVRGGDLIDKRLAGGRPVLGICVGMQVLFGRGIERGVDREGLGEWPGTVDELPSDVLPHMGWNTVRPPVASRLFAGLADERFYFVHSNAAQKWELEVQPPLPAASVTWATHGGDFIAAVENGPLAATQFHPEKSGDAGMQLLENWLATL